MGDLVKRLRDRRASWIGAGMGADPICIEAADRIEGLERELRVYMDAAEGHLVERMRLTDQLAAEKALADELHDAWRGDEGYTGNPVAAAYRKARGGVMSDVYLDNESLTVENMALIGILQSNQYEIARLQEKADRQQALITKMFNTRRNYVKHIRDSARIGALEEAAQHLEGWRDIYGDNAAAAIRAIIR